MPDYPIEPAKLMEVVDRLAPPEAPRGRPAYADHRRAVSTAYYALFHAITDRVVKAPFTEADDPFLRRVRRWVQHADIKQVAIWVSQLEGTRQDSPPAHIRALLAPSDDHTHIDPETVTMAEGFLELNEKREQADYDHDAVFTRPDTLGLVALARQVIEVTVTTQSDPAKRFFGLIAMQAKVQKR
jgi:hypothetical protein